MPDYTDREIPVLDDIISSPLKTDELLTDAEISDEPKIQTNVQLDIQLDEPILNNPVLSADSYSSSSHDKLTNTPHLINPEQKNSEHSDGRIEPALHQSETTQTFAHETPVTDNSINDRLNESIETNQSIEKEIIEEEYDDSDILPSGERLYRYIPEVQETIDPQADHQASEKAPAEPSATQDINGLITDPNSDYDNSHTHDSISDTSVIKTESEPPDVEHSHTEPGDDNHQNEKRQTDDYADNVPEKDVAIPANTQQADIAAHESALIDYQTDIDPYSMDETEENSQTSDLVTDDIPQWQDIQQEISGIQAETNATATENLVLSTLNNLDTDALTEQVLQNILPNVEQQLRLHIKESIQEALNTSITQINRADNNKDTPPEAESRS